MDEYTWSPILGFWHRHFTCFSRNPLVRNSDRIEAGAKLMLAFFALLVIAPIAAFGTSVHDRESQLAARQAVEWHTVTATAVDKSYVESRVSGAEFRSHVRWSAGGSVHVAWIDTREDLKIGDHTAVWVNNGGELEAPPLTRDQVTTYAWSTAVLLWLAVSGALYFALWVLRWRLNRRRYSGWDTGWQALDRDDGGRKDRFRQ